MSQLISRATEVTGLPPAPALIRLKTALVLFLLATLIIASFVSLKLNWKDLLSADALRNMQEFLAGFAPPDLSPTMLNKIFFATLETLAMSALGTGIAAILAIMLVVPGTGRLRYLTKYASALLFNICRAIPELVWASIMLIAAGLGPFAGTIALAAHTTGVLGRLFAEALDNQPSACTSTLRINGSGTINTFLYASLPQGLPQMMSYTLYRWENNIRAAAILGVVGAGGLGQMLKYHLSLFQMSTAATVIIAMLILVAMVDALSFAIRRRLVN
ncbi:phosphonate ABC transporter, permease protein PhnE [Undibacterium sp. SXout20W]|uniref:phosphonate ABC transporter, permease protein PhnE n=1 Tax=Undibacterium sp. SXout20W TaxID=3413051 RepID=UPI003BF31FC3